MKIKGTVVLMKRNVLDFNDLGASLLDNVHELLGKKVSLQLISSHISNPGNSLEGKPAHLEEWLTKFTPLAASESAFQVTFDWDKDNGVPGAFLIRNDHHSEFYIKTLTLEDVPGEGESGGQGRVHFVCNSWVYPAKYYKKDRVFFTNTTYLPDETPLYLRKYREQELVDLRGDGKSEELQQWDRVYDYAPYNDLGDPRKGQKYTRPVLGGSSEYPYPRRGRTGRPPSESDPKSESRVPLLASLNIYVPADERLNHIKMSDFIAYNVRALGHFIKPEVQALFDSTPKEFDSFDDIMELYRGGVKLPEGSIHDHIKNVIPFEMIKDAFDPDGAGRLSYPLPQIIKEDRSAWRTDEEFAREMVAGVHPLLIRRLEEFPPKSKLDYQIYGDQNSRITEAHIHDSLDGMSVHKAIENRKLFIVDHHDVLMPYLRRINTTSAKAYTARTLLFLREDSNLKPVAIELSLPHPDGDQCGAISKVYTPAHDGVEGSIWQLAKAYVGVNDNNYHQMISHWLQTHAVIEPFIIAANRQLSVLHPINKLLHPHFRDTMNINALARQSLINAGGFLELALLSGQYSMELSSKAYKNWVFPEQALPEDLKRRGMAVEDPKSQHGLRLLIEDYPYAVDGLEIWSAIKEWVKDYCSMYYKTDEMVQGDQELQSWWKELREQGHCDKKDEHWWPKMRTREELTESCTIIIWLASAFHASVNFGMYAYAGYLPNRPTMSRRFMPEIGSPEYDQLKSNPDRVFLQTITAQLQALLGMSLIEVFSIHSADEVYLGQRDTPDWTSDKEALQAFNKFGKRLSEIGERMLEMNKDTKLKNRVGPVQLPYTFLVPNSESGLTGRGIPNSVTI